MQSVSNYLGILIRKIDGYHFDNILTLFIVKNLISLKLK